MTHRPRINRRHFLKAACGTGAAWALPHVVPAAVLGRDGRTAPSNRLQMAAIGMGFAWPMFLREDVRYVPTGSYFSTAPSSGTMRGCCSAANWC